MPTRSLLALAAALLAAAFVAVPNGGAATFLGSPDSSRAPEAYACAACPAGATVGFRQFALRGADVEAPEDGVLVEASAYARRISGTDPARVAVLRPSGDGIGVEVVASAPLPVTSPAGAVEQAEGLRLPVRRGDSVGLLFRAGQVDLGVRSRPKPDGAVQPFRTPCGPCGMDGGTGMELLLDAVLEPDVDADGLGDESQDPDGGGLGMDWEDDWFDDFDEGDELDEDLAPDARRPPRRGAGFGCSTSTAAAAVTGRTCCCASRAPGS